MAFSGVASDGRHPAKCGTVLNNKELCGMTFRSHVSERPFIINYLSWDLTQFMYKQNAFFFLLQDLKKIVVKNTEHKGFPGGTVVENLPANAGDTGSSPGLGRSHMPRNNWAREPQLLSLRVWSLCSTTREAAIVRGPRTAMNSGPRLPQLEKALAQKRRPNTAMNR